MLFWGSGKRHPSHGHALDELMVTGMGVRRSGALPEHETSPGFIAVEMIFFQSSMAVHLTRIAHLRREILASSGASGYFLFREAAWRRFPTVDVSRRHLCVQGNARPRRWMLGDRPSDCIEELAMKSQGISIAAIIAATCAGCGGNGTPSSGTASGGNSSVGGNNASGGTTQNTGGSSATGGSVLSTGGNSGTGGTATGGTATGGTRTNVGGQSATGGTNVATGGTRTNVGGQSATGGAQATGGGSSTGGTSSVSTNCSITATSSLSTAIATVGIVQFSTTLSNLTSAHIDFGLDTNYGMTAPVDLTQSNNRTLLLGMKSSKTYHFRVVAQTGSTQCTSSDYTVTTGARPTDLPTPTVVTNNQSAVAGGFLVAEGYRATSPDDYAFILDADGELVWWYKATGFADLTAAKMSYDGNYIWVAHGNVPQGTAHVARVSMDGLTVNDYSSQFTGLNHDLTILPDETVIFIAYGTNGCDDIKERSTNGTVRTIINSGAPFGNSNACHCNAIQYSKDDDTVVVSELDHNGYFKVTRQGQVKWVLGGGTYNSFDKSGGGASSWTSQHNIHILGLDHVLFFNNGGGGGGGVPSKAIELNLNLTAMTTSQLWSYTSNPTISNGVMGDVQRLDNGNTVVAYSTQGIIHEVDSSGTLVQKLTWTLPKTIGYITKRKTLYGAPPR